MRPNAVRVCCPNLETFLSPRLARLVVAALSGLSSTSSMTAGELLARAQPGETVELDMFQEREFRTAIRVAVAWAA